MFFSPFMPDQQGDRVKRSSEKERLKQLDKINPNRNRFNSIAVVRRVEDSGSLLISSSWSIFLGFAGDTFGDKVPSIWRT
jgi:hypothetical protein